MKRFILVGSAFAVIGLALSAAPAIGVTIAQEPAPTVVAADSTLMTTQVLADHINGVTVISPVGGIIAAQASGHQTRAVKVRAGQRAVLNDLDPGVRYTITRDGKRIGFVVPVGQMGPAFGLSVVTTDNPGEVTLSWSHTVNKGEGPVVQYTATATAVGASAPAAKVITSDTHATLSGLDIRQRYTFSVTPANSASTGRASTATMQQTLAQFTGALVDQSAPLAQPTPATPAPAPAPAPAAAPAPAPVPSTRTIWVCPDGYADAGSLCQKTLAYTYHSVTSTWPYSYHQQFMQTGSHINFSTSPNGGTYYAQNAWDANGSAAGYYEVVPDGYYASVKDPAPTGYTDNGSAYTKTDQVKDTPPAGYSDNGTAWVMTTAKIAQQVPA
ncbi:MAG: fibronectin type III domain-containing protein [Actinomycetota bacterium]|nr:fibronectin type III domain-containing protein [Actinomycetota bacterium]